MKWPASKINLTDLVFIYCNTTTTAPTTSTTAPAVQFVFKWPPFHSYSKISLCQLRQKTCRGQVEQVFSCVIRLSATKKTSLKKSVDGTDTEHILATITTDENVALTVQVL